MAIKLALRFIIRKVLLKKLGIIVASRLAILSFIACGLTNKAFISTLICLVLDFFTLEEVGK
jgi:NAD/NADP transhydrogenase beta subunit